MVLRKKGDYFVEINKVSKSYYICFAETEDRDVYINKEKQLFCTCCKTNSSEVSIKYATSSEIEHLNQCIQAGHYVSYNPLNIEELWY